MSHDPASALFPKTRKAVLGLLYSHPGDTFYLRQIVDITGLAVGQVQRELKHLTRFGIISRKEGNRRVYFRASEVCPIYDELRSIVTKTMGAVAVIREALEPLRRRIDIAFVFGSVAHGNEKTTSDVDLMVIGKVTFAEVAAASRDAESVLLREVNPVVYPPAELRDKVSRHHHFLERTLHQDKVFVIGDYNELTALFEEQLDS